ncbi:hypothetical protein FSARC_17 [Fusarium sarcochroum]|uniref:Uncharacterized protein n=1 Tax=Fusarium sarcochroum TaxID=1208366 RepID=A0A8H4UCZ4_9HYPO|nr:hypothetical protein FSARC_17 [Fusarium sarcochroum]
MSSPISSYHFDDEGMTWITCDLCAGSFQREAVSHTYFTAASAPPPAQGGAAPPPPPPPPKGDKAGHSHGTSSGFGVYSRRS